MVPKTRLDVALCFPVNIFLYQYNYIGNDYHLSLHKPLVCVAHPTKATMSKFKLSKFLNGRNCSCVIIGTNYTRICGKLQVSGTCTNLVN